MYRNKNTKQVGEVVHKGITTTLRFDDGSEVILSPARLRNEWEEVAAPTKLTYFEFCEKMKEWNLTHDGSVAGLSGVICYKQKNFSEPYTEEQRSYRVWNTSGHFQKDWTDDLVGDCLDGTDDGCNLDLYNWSVEYCILD